MNCNNNTSPLLEERTDLICNNGCTPKDINVICKKIIIPTGQETLGIQGENNSATRYFLIPKTSENGDDLSDKNFSIIIKNSGGVSTEIEVESPEILENYIKIKFSITEAVTEVSGNLTLQIQAKTNGDYIWKTYPAVFNIANSL